MGKIAIYPGTFDPITKGHLDIIERSSKLFDQVIVVIMENHNKNCLFSKEKRLEMIIDGIKEYPNVKVEIGKGLTIEFANSHNANVVIRGLRSISDYEYEQQIASVNMWLDHNVETVFLFAKPEYSFLSSSSVKTIASFHKKVDDFVTDYVQRCLNEKFQIE